MEVTPQVWKVESIGDYSLVLIPAVPDYDEFKKKSFLPNPTDNFIKKYGKHDIVEFYEKYTVEFKEALYTPQTLIVYFNDKIPDWIEEGMEIIY